MTVRPGSPSLANYIRANHWHLMTDAERLVDGKLILVKRVTACSADMEALLDRVAERVLREHSTDVFLNRCPQSDALGRTPRARLCPECHYSWHWRSYAATS